MDKLEQLLTKMNSEFAEYEAWLLQQPASVILENAFQYTTKQDILMHAESAVLSPAQLETLLRLKAPLEEVFEAYRNTDSDFLMVTMHDAMETCADDAMAVQRTAPVYPQVKWLREHGVKADVIIGAKTRDMLIYTDAMRAVAENLHIATDDGSEGFKGLVTALIGELIEKEGRHYDECVAIGPMIMMKFVALTTKKYALKTTVSLNALMVDGTGMCGACRVTVGGRTRFTCVDGPEFDAHEVDFDEAMRRQGMYRTQEQRAAAIEAEREAGHVCKIGLDK